ncbi:MAG: hypothetical protein ABL897_02090 [Hyphomicrobium sp.]
MRSAGTANRFRFFAGALVFWGVFAVTATFVSAGAGRPLMTADDADRGLDETDGAEGDSPGATQRQRDFDTPSEDGTDDAPGSAAPNSGESDRPPGCNFRDGPLELVV